MTVLVAAASEHGATAEIAVWLGAALAQNGVDVDVRKLEEVSDVEHYEAVVLGSAVYFGQWLKTACRFIDTHAADLARRPTWLFSSGYANVVHAHPKLASASTRAPTISRTASPFR